MNRKIVFSLYKKEMLDVFRDKKTIIMMVLIPLFLYPVMLIGSLLIMTNVMKESQEQTYRIGLCDFTKEQTKEMEQSFTESLDLHEYHFVSQPMESEDKCKDALSQKEIDAYICIDVNKDGKVKYSVYYLSSINASSTASGMLKEVLNDLNDAKRDALISMKFDEPKDILYPIEIEMSDQATKEESAGSIIGYIIPFMMVTSILMGAIYPAIDVTAGERERGTLETMMTLPVKNVEMMMSKFMAVSTVAVLSAILNMLSMFGVCLYMYDSMQLAQNGFENINLWIYLPAVCIVIVCILVFAMFTAAVCLCVCLFAKSFKEANNYSTPVLLIFLFASMAGIIPSVELTMKTAAIPIVNISLLIKSVFLLQYDYQLIAIVLVSNVVYSILAVIFMSRLFNSEDVLFGESFRSVKFFERRSNMKDKQMPGIGDLVLMFGLLLLFMIYLSGSFVLRFQLWGTALCQLLILLLPILYAWYMKADMKKLFSIKVPKLKYIAGGIFLWIGVWLLEQVVLYRLQAVFPSLSQTAESLNEIIMKAGFPLAFFVVAICPALAEEAAFRGFLFGTLKSKWKLGAAILISAIFFGLYHMNLLQFVGGFMVGTAMAFAVAASGSIFVSVIMHFINNGISVLFHFYPELLNKIPILSNTVLSVKEQLILLAFSCVFLFLGVFCMRIGKNKTRK